MRISRVTGRHLAALATPIAALAFMRGGAALASFVSDPGQNSRFDAEAVRALFQLERMGAMPAVAQANGRSLADAAEALAIAHIPARSHLRALFAETGAQRQSQLIHLLHGGVQAVCFKVRV